MNWLGKILGYRDREYRGSDFSVRLEKVAREVVYVNYSRGGTKLSLGGQRIGRKWEGIEVLIPQQVEGEQLALIVRDLENALQAMRYGYVISHLRGVEVIAESERQAAIAELGEMGWEIEVSADRTIRRTKAANAQRRDMKTIRKDTPHMMALIQTIQGKRQSVQLLTKSKEF